MSNMQDNTLRDALVTIAEEIYGDTHEDTSAQLFALVCNAVKVLANEYHVERHGPRSANETPAHEMAEVLGPIVANMCPDYVIVADSCYVAD